MNGRIHPIEMHVSNNCQSFDDLRECAEHITVPVPEYPQIFEYLIDSITSEDNNLQADIELVHANTKNMRENSENAASALLEVDPYRISQR